MEKSDRTSLFGRHKALNLFGVDFYFQFCVLENTQFFGTDIFATKFLSSKILKTSA